MKEFKEHFHIAHVEFCNRLLLLEGNAVRVSLTSLTKPKDVDRGQAYLNFTVITDELASCVHLVCEVLAEDVLELKVCHAIEDELYQEFEACVDQGEAVCSGLCLSPSLKTLVASYPKISCLESIVNLGSPKLSLNHLQLGNYTHLFVSFQISQRMQHIERYVAPEFSFYDSDENRHTYLLRMPYTRFGEIKIDSVYASRFIIALSTSTSTTYHGVGIGSDLELPIRHDFQSEDEDDDDDNFVVYNPDNVGKIVIYCFDVKKIKIGYTTIVND